MKRMLAALIGFVIVASEALAHFPFIVPSADGSKMQVVFNDVLKPDERVPIDRIEATRLFAVDEKGRETPVEWTKQAHALVVDLAGEDFLLIGGVTDRGFVQSKHTDDKPVWIKHYPKAVIGDLSQSANVRLGESVTLELVPVLADQQLRFQALWQGQPLPAAEVVVLVPGEAQPRTTKTDEQGITEDSFNQRGRYGARVGIIEQAVGELQGHQYEEIRSYATLVLDFGAADQ